jgi:hypothetical protein
MESYFESEWGEYFKEGERYLQIVSRDVAGKSKFTPVIRYNMLGMAVEKLCMGYLLRINRLPINHTFTDLMDELASILSVPEDITLPLKELEQKQFLCDTDVFSEPELTNEDIDLFIKTTTLLETYLRDRIHKELKEENEEAAG